MKRLLLLILPLSLLFSCANKPDNVIYNTTVDSLYTGWQVVGDGSMKHTEKIKTTLVTVKPTWGQAFHWAFKSGYAVWFIFSIVFLAAAAYLFYLKTQDRKVGVAWIFALLCASLGSFGTQPGSIKWNNDKVMPKDSYDGFMRDDGNLKGYWDAEFEANHILWAGHK